MRKVRDFAGQVRLKLVGNPGLEPNYPWAAGESRPSPRRAYMMNPLCGDILTLLPWGDSKLLSLMTVHLSQCQQLGGQLQQYVNNRGGARVHFAAISGL